jgi:hypothetical protein
MIAVSTRSQGASHAARPAASARARSASFRSMSATSSGDIADENLLGGPAPGHATGTDTMRRAPSRRAVSRAAHSTACSDSSEPSVPATMVLAGILSSLPDLSAIAAPAPTTPGSALASSPAIGARPAS